jgi:integrase/recombinase XerD
VDNPTFKLVFVTVSCYRIHMNGIKQPQTQSPGMHLFDAAGRRLYLTEDERRDFMAAAVKASREVRTFCGVLHATGCRISEALALTPQQIDLSGRMVVFESLKKRKRGVYRAVPVPPDLLDTLDMVHGIREAQRRGVTQDQLWPWSRMTAFRRVQEVIQAAGIPDGPHACPKGLRHGFGVQAVSRGISLNMVQKWLGHAQLTTTAIYANAVGEEEQNIAARMW